MEDLIKALNKYINKELTLEDLLRRVGYLPYDENIDMEKFEYDLEMIWAMTDETEQYEKAVNLINNYFGKYL